MESLDTIQPVDNLVEEPIVDANDDESTSSPRKHHKTKQRRKTSMIPLRHSEKLKNRTSQCKQSLEQNKQELSETDECDLPSLENACLSAKCEEDTNDTGALYLMQMKIDDKDIVQSLQSIEINDAGKDQQAENDSKPINEETSKEVKQKNVRLEEKLIHYDRVDLDGTLDLSSLNITDNDIPLIIQRAFRNETKKCIRLILRDNSLTSTGIKILVDALTIIPTSLKNLGLSGNSAIGDVGIEHLSRLLQTNRSITLLALHNTGVTDRGVRLLANVLCSDIDVHSISSLEKLYISFNKLITDESLEALIQILEHNQSLKILSLQHCNLSDRVRRRLRQVTVKKKNKKFNLSE